ncbi:molybdopterin dinucleotide binding domain-containing protein [Amycolatopsis sp. lyj-109]|uniref:molybdopterin dinucleotide binding domain-containing protein n=1 Tax=Amycolatopsis sp. lyj-109 TaxID=2789287 RepID=UPI003979F890
MSTGDVALVRSAQGSLLAGVVVTDVLLPGVAQMHTGAWFDPSAPEVADCVNGNVNVLTYDGPVPPVRAYEPPPLVPAS